VRLRRRVNRVRETMRELPPAPVNEGVMRSYGAEIVRLRGEVQRAIDVLAAPVFPIVKVTQARAILEQALEEAR
jgi:uncharacterized radical SAM superfamily protein